MFKNFFASNDEQVVEAEFEEVMNQKSENIPFTGRVVSVHDGYSYIGEVKRGFETINTNGDVFIPKVLEVGDFVEFFELVPDQKRHGKFRTEIARVVNGTVVSVAGQSLPIQLYKNLVERHVYHVNAKKIDPVQVEKAAENGPFAEMLFAKLQQQEEVDAVKLAENFLRGSFAGLESYGFSFKIDERTDLNAEDEILQEAFDSFKGMGLDGQVGSLREEYTKFLGIRGTLQLMQREGILQLDAIIPLRNLPDLLVACPVWFFAGKSGVIDQLAPNGSISITHMHTFFCNAVGTDRFANFFQIYNRRIRGFARFSGRDIMPPRIAKFIREAQRIFDYLIIATPYHDIASREWQTPWQRNVDPFLVGFMQGVDYMFLLGRWSGTGLFPLICDMVADTMDHLRCNKAGLRRIPGNLAWYQPERGAWSPSLDPKETESSNSVLEPFADQVLAAYDAGRLFSFLREKTVK